MSICQSCLDLWLKRRTTSHYGKKEEAKGEKEDGGFRTDHSGSGTSARALLSE